ncbi:MAG: hypothetical protein QHH05_00155 [Syntrophomonadaceae bacterium]|nr:hypothetical protein [Syntrophomonadaceae bacterium]
MLVLRTEAGKDNRLPQSLSRPLADLLQAARQRYGLELQALTDRSGVTAIRSVPDCQEAEEAFYFRFTWDEDAVYIANLQVPRRLRGRGMGRQCVQWLSGHAARCGVPWLKVETCPGAAGFWKRLGFVEQAPMEDF